MSLLETMPPATAIQDRLGELAHEEKLVRDLLRLAVRAQEERERRAGQAQGESRPLPPCSPGGLVETSDAALAERVGGGT